MSSEAEIPKEENQNEKSQEGNVEGGEGNEIIEEPKPINPYSYIPVLEDIIKIIGENFVDCKNEHIKNIKDDILSCKLLGLFFSSSWGSPCKIFGKELLNIYNEVNEGEKIFEIIEISFDKKEDEFKKGIAGKPWKFIPYNDPIIQQLTQKYEVLTIPKFFPIDKKGDILSDNARKELVEGGSNVCEEWINYLVEEVNQKIEKEKENNHDNDNIQEENSQKKEEIIQKEEETKIEKIEENKQNETQEKKEPENKETPIQSEEKHEETQQKPGETEEKPEETEENPEETEEKKENTEVKNENTEEEQHEEHTEEQGENKENISNNIQQESAEQNEEGIKTENNVESLPQEEVQN